MRARTRSFGRAAVLAVWLPLGGGLSAQGIDLGDVTLGGDGTGTAPAANVGLDMLSGAFVTGGAPGTVNAAGTAPVAVVDSDYIDSVFIIGPPGGAAGAPYEQTITQSGVTFVFPAGDATGTSWYYIYGNAESGEGQKPPTVGNRTFETAVGIHAAAGITYNLDALREVGDVGCFLTYWGSDSDCGGSNVNLYAIVSNDVDGVIASKSLALTVVYGEAMSLEIPAEAQYLTLAVGALDGNIGCAHGMFGQPTLASDCAAEPVALGLTPAAATLAPGFTLQLAATSLNDVGLPLEDLTAAASGTVYTVAPAGVVQVSADGLVTALAAGVATVTATNGTLEGTSTITVETIESLRVIPGSAATTVGKAAQLQVIGVSASGTTFDATAVATTYAASPAGVVSVSAAGLVTAVAVGEAEVTATHRGAVTAKAGFAVVGGFIDLGNVAAGGNGVDPVPAGNLGINAETGTFRQAREEGNVTVQDGVNPQPVPASSFVDSVFVIQSDIAQVINTAGVAFDFAAGDSLNGWANILDALEPGGPDYLEMGTAGRFYNGVGIHAAQGITYDLDALRAQHGAAAVKHFWAIAGEASGQAGGSAVNAYAILSDGFEVLPGGVASVSNATDRGELIQLEIPEGAQFLTLACGAFNSDVSGDHGAFALAQVSAVPFDASAVSSLEASPPLLRLAIGDPAVQIALRCQSARTGFRGLTIVPDPEDATYSSSDRAVATVSAAGEISAVGAGSATIQASFGGQSVQIPVFVDVVAIDLNDVTAGGDGKGTAPAENVGVNPADGTFVQTYLDGRLNETPGTANPEGVADSDFIDSVFFIGPTGDPDADVYTQAITLSGIGFDFPNADAIGTGWNYILRDANGGEGPNLSPPVTVGRYDYTRGVGIHSACGITYDLDLLREVHGADAVGTFVTAWGMDNGPGNVNLYAILSSDADGIIASRTFNALQYGGAALILEIPAGASYLTLATGSNGADGSDHGTFAEAMILPKGGVQPGVRFRRGDANADGGLNITDGIFVLNYLFLGGTAPPCLEAADANDDGGLNITDGIFTLNYLFLGGSAPPAPGPDACGLDEDADEFDCASYPQESC